MHGKGIYTYKDGISCEGQWENGLKQGKFQVTSKDGTINKYTYNKWWFSYNKWIIAQCCLNEDAGYSLFGVGLGCLKKTDFFIFFFR